MADPAGVAGQAPAAARLRRRRIDPAEAGHARLPVQGAEQRQDRARRDYTGIVPDTFKDGSEVVLQGHAERRRLPRRAERRDGEVPVEVRSRADRARHVELPPWPPSARSSCSPASSSAAYAVAASVAGARRRSRRLIESGIGAFYLVAALMTVASAVIINAFVTDDYSIKYVQHYSDSGAAAVLQDHVVLGRPRRLDHVLGVPAVGLRHRSPSTSTASATAS